MISYPIANNEKQRLAVLDEYHIIQTNKECEFERISALAKAFLVLRLSLLLFWMLISSFLSQELV